MPAPFPDAPLQLPDLADRGNIQNAIGQVLNAFGASRLSRRSARLFLYALQVASPNIQRAPATGKKFAGESTTWSPARQSGGKTGN
jgi:hypothetical protein